MIIAGLRNASGNRTVVPGNFGMARQVRTPGLDAGFHERRNLNSGAGGFISAGNGARSPAKQADTVHFKGTDEDKKAVEAILFEAFGVQSREALMEKGWLVAVESPNMDGFNTLKAEYSLIKSGDARHRSDPVILFWDWDCRKELLSRQGALEDLVTTSGRPVLIAFMSLPPSKFPDDITEDTP